MAVPSIKVIVAPRQARGEQRSADGVRPRISSPLGERESIRYRNKASTAAAVLVCGASSSEEPPFTRGAFLGRRWVQHVNQGDAHDLRTRRSAGHLSHTLILAPCLMRDTENWFLGLADKSTPPVIITCSLITRRERKKIPFLRCQTHRTLPVWMEGAQSDSLNPSLALPSLLRSRPSLPLSSQFYLQAISPSVKGMVMIILNLREVNKNCTINQAASILTIRYAHGVFNTSCCFLPLPAVIIACLVLLPHTSSGPRSAPPPRTPRLCLKPKSGSRAGAGTRGWWGVLLHSSSVGVDGRLPPAPCHHP